MSESRSKSYSVSRGWAPPFFCIWTGQAVSLLGSSLVQFALVWWLTDRTGSATVLTLATLVALLPKVILGPVAGTLVDRWNRRIVMLGADSGIALVTVGLIVLFAAREATTGAIFVALLLRALGEMFHQPAMSASTPLMVPERHLARVAGINQTLTGMVTIIAPPLGALLLELLPMQGVLAIDVVTALIAILPLLVIMIPQPPRAPDPASGRSVLEDLAAGLRYVWAWPGLRVLLLMAMAIMFCMFPAFALVPLLVKEHFGGDVGDLGWFQSIWGAGLLAGGLTLGVWGGFERRIVTFLVGLTGLGAGLLVVGLMPSGAFLPAMGAMFSAGIMLPIHAGPYTAAVQASVIPHMQGRVTALLGSATNAMAPISLTIAGPLADSFGPSAWFVLAGSLCMLMGLGGFLIPPLMGLEEQGRALAAVE